MDTKLSRKEPRRKLRWVGVIGEVLMAVCAGVVTINLFMPAYFAVVGESYLVHLDRAYLGWELHFALVQPPSWYTVVAKEVVLALVRLGLIFPAAVGMALWWWFGRPAFRRLVGAGLLGLGRSRKQPVSRKRSRA